MLNMKKLVSALALSTVALTTAPMVMADDDYIYQQNKAQYISHEKAAQIAKAQVKDSQVKNVEFDYESYHGATFDVELFTGQGIEYDVKVDAKTGKVLKVKRDY